MAYQRAYFPTKIIDLSQGYGSKTSTHKYSYALDLAGTYDVLAPFDCKVTKLYVKKGHSYEVWLTSTNKVLCVNGYYGYLTISFTHPEDISKLKVGQKFKQFDKVCNTKKMTGVSTGSHLHLELSKGTKAGWQVINGDYVNVNKIKPEEYLFIKEETIIKDNEYKGDKYKFIKESDLTYKVYNVPSEPLLIRNKLGFKIGKLYNGDEVIKFDNNAKCLVYHYSVLGYTYSKYLKR